MSPLRMNVTRIRNTFLFSSYYDDDDDDETFDNVTRRDRRERRQERVSRFQRDFADSPKRGGGDEAHLVTLKNSTTRCVSLSRALAGTHAESALFVTFSP